MQKKWWGLILIMVSVVVAVSIFFIITQNMFPKEIEPYYSDDPKTWVEDKGRRIMEINVDKVTKGEGYVDNIGEQYNSGEVETVFGYEGWYKGNYFKEEYYEGGNKIMTIGPEMTPGDGIISGFVLERFEEGVPYIYVFLDEDWRNTIPNTKVYWGSRFQNEMDFTFDDQISDGIYMIKVEDDVSRFENNYALISGGLYVGDLREDESSTIIAFY